jgi:hypothetical protein
MRRAAFALHCGYNYPPDMDTLTIRRAKGGYVIETDQAIPQIARDLPEMLVMTASALEGDAYMTTRVGNTIILTSSQDKAGD